MKISELSTVYSEEIEYISTLFNTEGISYNEQELLINIDDAWRAIACYLWIDYNSENIISVKTEYSTLICKLAIAYFSNAQVEKSKVKGDLAITQMSQGSRSVTYRTNIIELDNYGLTAEIKAALPPRKLRVL